MDKTLDVIIIGAGSAGLAALREVHKRSESFLLINDGAYGTTCARVGCMPSKALIEAANAFHRRHSFDAFGIRGAAALSVDVPAVLRRVRALRDDFVAGTLAATDELGERSLAGRARLLDAQTVAVGERRYHARRIVIASGSQPVIPDAWRAFGDRIVTTDTLFELETLPRRMAVVGLGAIGIEIAQALSRLGVEVTGFGANPRLAGLSDEAVDLALRELLDKEFAFHTSASAELSPAADGIEVRSGAVRVVADQVIAAIGRRPNVAGLGLETLGVELDARGMPPVNPNTLQIADLPIFLAGDANGRAALLHEAADEGHIAGINAMATELRCFRRRTPLAIVFADPNVAVVGQRFADLDAAQLVIGQASFKRQGRARTAQHNKGLMRLYADRNSGRLLGGEMCVPAGEHMAHVLALAIERELSVQELLRLPFYHPVLEEGMRGALRDLSAQLPAGSDSDLASCGAYKVEALD
ncbi:MAG: Dihydrolipoyl dehydrogenase [Candidatus Accumulibacter regalis]|mgnify:FL=1|jgi:dihydrolipoamide dehydrogenase|uniref:Dihydrolipoyl dehydrogenase n=2 Tax=Candidatus Accumulibacter TaxID=327159 RepID=A0A011NXT6_ACCRE|nr:MULTISPECIES: dihydrolipoyl dehydrogenase [unclassified Candidatus Accumulibacter]EXI87478.1 MAG: Dihydrolipoyl dehydrogenase [Candidatus Accumulibacter regalis]MBL8369511.1 dihydrolipoyl dehydrogenase [Accumulibacter sp.]HRE70813.1 dihydrolipoyl dehydrogenase [Accumulibacter sp.]HRE85913.1 dihydrolipoyl dehydrogenase [Accumulibacter sp.]